MKNKPSKKIETTTFESVFEYKSMIHYILTVLFIFALMLSIVFLISLSRYALSDADVENHVLNTKSLLEELDQVEKSQTKNLVSRFENISLNYSNHNISSPLSRLHINDSSLLMSNSTQTSYITLRFNKYRFKNWNGEVIVRDIVPQINEEIVYLSNVTSQTHKGIVIANNKEELVVLSSITNDEGESIMESVQQANIRGILLY